MRSDQLLLVGPPAGTVDLLGFWGTTLHESDGGEDVKQELQVFRLPVLGGVHGEVRGREVIEERDGRGALGHLLIVVL